MHGTFTSCMFLEDSMKIKYILSNRKKTLPNVAEQHQGILTLLDISSQYLKNKQENTQQAGIQKSKYNCTENGNKRE